MDGVRGINLMGHSSIKQMNVLLLSSPEVPAFKNPQDGPAGLVHGPIHQKVASLIPGQGTYGRQLIDVSLSLSNQ